MKSEQKPDHPIDIATWNREEEVYPEGKRVKTSVYCPNIAPHDFLEANHRYIFKRSPFWAPEQYWVEIFAYQLGKYMNIDVPPTYVAFDSQKNYSGALVRWFLDSVPFEEEYIRGGDLCQEQIPSFNRKSGEQHNFETIVKIFEQALPQEYPESTLNWKTYWAKTLVFDALIGNTDRHQDNWGIIESFQYKLIQPNAAYVRKARIAPVYDNGSSMGGELANKTLTKFKYDEAAIEKYVRKGLQHMRWSLDNLERIEHCEFLKRLIHTYPEMQETMLDSLQSVNEETFNYILNTLTEFNVIIKLSQERSDFMLRLITLRHNRLLKVLSGNYICKLDKAYIT